MDKKTIGIIGGMGPLATADLFTKIVKMTDASCDAEHIHILIDNFPQIPDRTKAILENGQSPVPYLLESANRLVRAGADFLIIPCITSHYFYDDLAAEVNVPILNIVEETAKFLKSKHIDKTVLLATNGTRNSGVFEKIFKKHEIELFLPSENVQKDLMDVIYKGVKSGAEKWDTTSINKEIDRLSSLGADSVILGCTELPLAASMYGIIGNLVDPTDILAVAAIEFSGYNVKKDR